MKRLGDLILPDGIQWTDQQSSLGVMQSLQTTLGGAAILSTRALSYRAITLVAADPWCWISQAQTDALLAMAAIPGGSFPLAWDDLAMYVVFRHHDQPAVELTPLSPGIAQYVGTIKLMRV